MVNKLIVSLLKHWYAFVVFRGWGGMSGVFSAFSGVNVELGDLLEHMINPGIGYSFSRWKEKSSPTTLLGKTMGEKAVSKSSLIYKFVMHAFIHLLKIL